MATVREKGGHSGSGSRKKEKGGPSSGRRNVKGKGGSSKKVAKVPDAGLPPRIFATNRYPPDGRINAYSKPEYLLDIVHALEGTPEFSKLMESPFGNLFQLPLKKCSLSGKLLHNILCRGLVTEKEHELWFVYGGYPIRFSLREFAIVTGLPCGPFPPAATITQMQTPPEGENRYWDTLIGSNKATSVQEIVNMLKRDKIKPHAKRMPGWRRLRLALVVIVEGILICGSQPVRASIEVVEMVRNLESFMAYPWGRESFHLTLRMIKVGNKVDNVEALVDKFLQSHTLCHGFPLAIQLFIFKSIPMLEHYLPDDDDETFVESEKTNLTKLKTYHNKNILRAEFDEKVEVDSILTPDEDFDEDATCWAEDVEDQKVNNLLTLIDEGYNFKMEDWIGGYAGCALITPPAQNRVSGKLKGKEKKVGTVKTTTGGPQLQDEYETSDSEDILYQIEVLNYEHTSEIKKWWVEQKGKLKDQLKGEIISELLGAGWSDKSSRIQEQGEASPVCEDQNIPSVDNNLKALVDKVGASDRVEETVADINRGIWDNYSGVPDILLDLNESDKKEEDKEEGGKATVKSGVPEESRTKNEEPGGSAVVDNKSPHIGVEESSEEEDSSEEEVSEPLNDKNSEKEVSEEEESEEDEVDDRKKKETIGEEDASEKEGAATDGGDEGSDEGEDETEDMDEAKEKEGNVSVNEEVKKSSPSVDKSLAPGKRGEKRGKSVVETETDFDDQSRPKRARILPSRFRSPIPPKRGVAPNANTPFEGVDGQVRKKFLATIGTSRSREFIIDGHPVKNTFFKGIHTPQNWVDTPQMEAMLSLLWRKEGDRFIEGRVGLLDTWFTTSITQEYKAFKCRKPGVPFRWNGLIRNSVRGVLPSRSSKMMWYRDVDVVYAPMNLGKGHWVAVAINLVIGEIEILDPLIEANDDKKLKKAMTPMVEMLPTIITEVLGEQSIDANFPSVFVYERLGNVSQNKRAGDCGPLAVKFIELHASGYELEGITDEMVDQIRMKYAVDIYEEFVQSLSV